MQREQITLVVDVGDALRLYWGWWRESTLAIRDQLEERLGERGLLDSKELRVRR